MLISCEHCREDLFGGKSAEPLTDATIRGVVRAHLAGCAKRPGKRRDDMQKLLVEILENASWVPVHDLRDLIDKHMRVDVEVIAKRLLVPSTIQEPWAWVYRRRATSSRPATEWQLTFDNRDLHHPHLEVVPLYRDLP